MSSRTHNTCPSALGRWGFWTSCTVMEVSGGPCISISHINPKRQCTILLPHCPFRSPQTADHSIGFLKNWHMAGRLSCYPPFGLRTIKEYHHTSCTAASCTSPIHSSSGSHPDTNHNSNSISCCCHRYITC